MVQRGVHHCRAVADQQPPRFAVAQFAGQPFKLTAHLFKARTVAGGTKPAAALVASFEEQIHDVTPEKTARSSDCNAHAFPLPRNACFLVPRRSGYFFVPPSAENLARFRNRPVSALLKISRPSALTSNTPPGPRSVSGGR